jgi:hypothetical protein
MRNFIDYQNWPENSVEAHKLLINAWYHLRNREVKEFETLEARSILNNVQISLANEITEVAA